MDTNIILIRDATIVSKYYAKDRPSLKSIGLEFNLSGERIRQIIVKNYAPLREPPELPITLTKNEKHKAKLAARILYFWENVDIKSSKECWEWKGYKHPKLSYGIFRFTQIEEIFTHRIAWRLHNQLKDPKNLHVLHECDNPSCVNPDHLFLGTKSENAIDRTKKGRTSGAKFCEEDIVEIRKLSKTKSSIEISKIYSCHSNTIRRIISKKSWKWI